MRWMSLHHGEPERVRVETAEMGIVEGGLMDDVGMAVQDLHQRALGDQAVVVEAVDDVVVDEGGAALVHQLGLPLGIEILRDVAHDAQQFALPGLQHRAVLLQEIEQVLLGQAQALLALARLLLAQGRLARVRRAWNGAPEIAIALSLVLQAFAPTAFVLAHLQLGGAPVAEHALIHQRVRGVEHRFDRFDAVALLAFGDVALGEVEIVENAARRLSIAGRDSCS